VSTEDKATETVKKRYNRIVSLYDSMEGLVERSRYSKWRDLLWSKVTNLGFGIFKLIEARKKT